MITIRQYREEDLEDVKALHIAGLEQFGESFDPYFDSDLDRIEEVYLYDNGDFMVGIGNGTMMVMGAIRKVTDAKCLLKRLRVRREFQRQGYGDLMLEKLTERARNLRYKQISLDTMADNIPAQRLFEKHGFIETRRGKTKSEELVFYEKDLTR